MRKLFSLRIVFLCFFTVIASTLLAKNSYSLSQNQLGGIEGICARRQLMVNRISSAASQFAPMMMRTITPNTGVEPDYAFHTQDVVLKSNGNLQCWVSLNWDARVTRFNSTVYRCELSGYVVITPNFEAYFYPERENEAVSKCEINGLWRKKKYFSFTMSSEVISEDY